jgi:ATP/maltotriose-dependent transcriptional regulator MalT
LPISCVTACRETFRAARGPRQNPIGKVRTERSALSPRHTAGTPRITLAKPLRVARVAAPLIRRYVKDQRRFRIAGTVAYFQVPNGFMLLTPQTLTPDRTGDRIGRPRLESRLASAVTASIAVLVGPPGAGKSELVRKFRTDSSAIYFRVGNENKTFARFVHGLACASVRAAPGAKASFPRAWERALQSPAPAIVLAHWLCEHLQGIDRHIVIDDLHDAAADLSIAAFIGKLAELRPDASLTITVRSVGALPIPLWMATRRMERPIDEAALRFTRGEVCEAAERFGLGLDENEVDALLAASGGSAIAIAYALTRLRCASHEFSHAAVPASFAAIAERIFVRRTGAERAFLHSAALYPNIDDALLALSGWDDAPAIRSAMASDAAFMWEPHADGGLRFHDRFLDYLAGQLQACDPDFRSTIAHRAARSLAISGRHAAALDVATRHRLIGPMGQLLDDYGFEILEAGEVDIVSETLDAFDAPEQGLGACATALRGYLEARCGRLDTAEAWFRLGLEKAEDEAVRVVIATYYARELALRRRDDACDVLAPFVDSTTLPRAVLIDVRSSFAQALTAANRLDEARLHTDKALAQLEPDSPPALRARVLARAAYVAIESGNPSLARERARIAAPLAEAQCLYDVAASAYSVLYQVAYDIDDDAVACLEYLHCMRNVGVRSGTLRFDLYVMLCTYELHVEAGDVGALAELDRQLAAVDKHDGTVATMESLLPGKALQAGWRGDFDAAQRLLRPSAEQQATPARKALCWAQIGLYCAAAGDTQKADEARWKAQDALMQCDDRPTQFGLALLTLALAALVGGDADGARRWTSSANDTTIGSAPRLRALRNVVEAMIVGSADADRFAHHVPGALAALWTVSFGGMAKLIEALPHRFAPSIRQTETIGIMLAKRELSARFAAAVESGHAGSLSAWLDTVRGSLFDGDAIAERFERWAVEQTGLDRRAQAALGNVRLQVAAYHRTAPAFVRLVENVDATIEALIERLAVAAPLMAEHSRAVSAWCSRLGRVLGLSEDEITFVSRCGLIHDIGKMRTPLEILDAPRKLSPDEWAIMRDHAAEGGRILGRVPVLAPLVPIVRGHHERLDGRGYPDGLQLSAIPLASRIVAVADSFNAMIGRRPYRLPLSPTAALDELDRNRRTQFDPEIVEAMVRVVLGRLAQAPTLKI